jgi:pilus assembly protein CpaF
MANIIKDKIKNAFMAKVSNILSNEKIDEDELRVTIARLAQEMINQEGVNLPENERQKLISEIVDEIVGFGPIENILRDPDVTEIMINGPKSVYVERRGKTEKSDVVFEDEDHLMYFVHKTLAPTRRRVDESYPYTEIALASGSRLNIIIPPLALDGPTITIRKFLKEIKTIEDLINLKTLDKRMADFLTACIQAKVNIMFSGATGAGKTTTLNVLSSYITNDERVVTIEDTAELRLNQEHVVRLESRQSNIEGKGEVSIRDLFKNSLRMRPDRIILGEIRGAEALDLLQAISSGHRGSLTVIHAGSPEDVVSRMETMILISGIPIGIEAIRRQIAAAVNLIVQQDQLLDGSRKITRVTQLNNLKDGQVVLEDVFVYDSEGINQDGKVIGRWRATGVIPVFYPLFSKAGINLPKEIFDKD